MKKHQDVQGIAQAGTPLEKIGVALNGRKATTRASDIIATLANVETLEELKARKRILKMTMAGTLCFQEPSKVELARINKESGSLEKYYDEKISRCKNEVADIVLSALKNGQANLFLHLADSCENTAGDNDSTCPADVALRAIRGKDITEADSRASASPADVAALSLSLKHEKTWPDVPMTKQDFIAFLISKGFGTLDKNTISAVIKRTGIKLKGKR